MRSSSPSFVNQLHSVSKDSVQLCEVPKGQVDVRSLNANCPRLCLTGWAVRLAKYSLLDNKPEKLR